MLLDGHMRQAEHPDFMMPVLVTDLTVEEAEQVLLTYDPLAAMAQTNADKLRALMERNTSDRPEIQRMMAELAERAGMLVEGGEVEERYSRKIDIPIYEPSNQKPAISELYDNAKTSQLLAEVATADLTDDERSFLTLAASRHIVFNYAKIADLYAHGSADLQRLMENSALVIVDFDRAIELGYVKLTQEIADMVSDEND
jgi:hypothetical protein